MDLNSFKECLTKQRDGSPIYVGDSVFYCRRWGTPESQKFVRDLRRSLFGPFHKAQDSDDSWLCAEWLCGYGVTRWENVTDGEKVIDFSESTARNIFLNPEYQLSLNSILIAAVMNFENYLYDEAEGDFEALKKK